MRPQYPQRHTIYNGCTANDPFVRHLWAALERFGPRQHADFLRFVWGRARLPTAERDFERSFVVQPLDTVGSAPDNVLPQAMTCFFTLNWPRSASPGARGVSKGIDKHISGPSVAVLAVLSGTGQAMESLSPALTCFPGRTRSRLD